LDQPIAKKPLKDLQNQSSRRFMPSLWDGCDPKSNIQKNQNSKFKIQKFMIPTTKTKTNPPYTAHLLQKLQPQENAPSAIAAEMKESGWYLNDLKVADLIHPLVASIFDDHLAKTPRPH
jgi:hypothetical protein